MDSYIITQEILHVIQKKRGNTNLMAAKIDLDKAYDKLDWSFIKFTLCFYHFPELVVDLILNCISSSLEHYHQLSQMCQMPNIWHI